MRYYVFYVHNVLYCITETGFIESITTISKAIFQNAQQIHLWKHGCWKLLNSVFVTLSSLTYCNVYLLSGATSGSQ